VGRVPGANIVEVSLKLGASELDEATAKVERLNELLEEANSIVNELATKKVVVEVSY